MRPMTAALQLPHQSRSLSTGRVAGRARDTEAVVELAGTAAAVRAVGVERYSQDLQVVAGRIAAVENTLAAAGKKAVPP
jgi:hypothetical protein